MMSNRPGEESTPRLACGPESRASYGERRRIRSELYPARSCLQATLRRSQVNIAQNLRIVRVKPH
jgi:hypothetical protein